MRGYVTRAGQVIRRDQGGDTVSEGQAYAMLMAAAIGDRPTFVSVWGWTQAHLLLPNGLLAWRWRGGAVADPQAASDADVGAAAALAMAARRFGDPSFLSAGRRLAASAASLEVGPTATGPTLVAGPWAVEPAEYVNPSYLNPGELSALAASYGRPWPDVANTARGELVSLSSRGALPPDWAVIGSDQQIHPAATPGSTGGSATFGFDAVRVPIWMSTSCSAPVLSAAARLVPGLERPNSDVGRTSVGLVALAAAKWAAGDHGAARTVLERAVRANRRYPSYYATALIALTTLSFDQLLEPC